jgi:drug/metabolite transporter (DMT)-like permease
VRSKIPAHLALFAVSLIYGINYVLAKEVMPTYVEPYGFIVIRMVGAGILFWIMGLLVKEKIDKKDFPRIIAAAAFGVAINQMMFFKGLNYTTSINASLIMVSNPIIVLVIASIILKDRITTRKIIGIILGSSGAVALIAYGKEISLTGENIPLGNLLVLVNATAYAIYLVIVKPLIVKYHPFTIIKWVFFFGFFMVTPFGYQEFLRIDWVNMPVEIVWRVAYVVIFTSFFAYLLNIYALQTLKPSTVSFYIYLQPIVASLLAVYLGYETFGMLELISSVLIFSGVYLVSVSKEKLKVKS